MIGMNECAANDKAISYIVEALDALPPDIVQLIYKIVMLAESGLE